MISGRPAWHSIAPDQGLRPGVAMVLHESGIWQVLPFAEKSRPWTARYVRSRFIPRGMSLSSADPAGV